MDTKEISLTKDERFHLEMMCSFAGNNWEQFKVFCEEFEYDPTDEINEVVNEKIIG